MFNFINGLKYTEEYFLMLKAGDSQVEVIPYSSETAYKSYGISEMQWGLPYFASNKLAQYLELTSTFTKEGNKDYFYYWENDTFNEDIKWFHSFIPKLKSIKKNDTRYKIWNQYIGAIACETENGIICMGVILKYDWLEELKSDVPLFKSPLERIETDSGYEYPRSFEYVVCYLDEENHDKLDKICSSSIAKLAFIKDPANLINAKDNIRFEYYIADSIDWYLKDTFGNIDKIWCEEDSKDTRLYFTYAILKSCFDCSKDIYSNISPSSTVFVGAAYLDKAL